ncbi:MAG: tetratricopeptide repeat protein [candidate division Zixibacteria bacterium]|nr:tetratricopeptide repeat protein [candidate division Zixibacteria bacterium]NIR67321.1 tetratricopeptide repeat protein [candidate division Zixibacteria bacterium]NIS16198.1 tetratricopeptide repeat protein [candidate division Zixibacteria bacterium]NIS48697.1 tetratricopeptide repeat protein [candidate division Zixibacteria bacterium]NIT52590.1 tetratricopeptide repeat protein [candidate division Zixibacteria bacterium]
MKKILIVIITFLFIASSLGIAQDRRLGYDGYLRSAKIYLQLTPKDYKKAAEMLEAAIKYYPDQPPIEAHYVLGTIYADKNLFEEMRKEFEYVLTICDTAQSEDIQDECDKEDYVENIQDVLASKWIQQYNNGVSTLKRARDQDASCEPIEDSILKAECDSTAMDLYMRAAESFQISTMILPDSAQGWINLGLIYYSIDSTDKALSFYQEALQINDQDLSLLSNMFSIYFNTGQYDSAIAIGKKMMELELTPQSRADMLYNMSIGYNALDEIDSAIVYLKKSIEITPDSPDALYNLGAFIIKSAADLVNKLGELQDSVEVNAAKYEPIRDSINQEVKVKYREAADVFEQCVELDPDNMEALDWLGQAYFFLEEWDKSKEVSLKIIDLEPENEDAWCQLLIIYLKENNKEKIQEAREHCTRYDKKKQ